MEFHIIAINYMYGAIYDGEKLLDSLIEDDMLNIHFDFDSEKIHLYVSHMKENDDVNDICGTDIIVFSPINKITYISYHNTIHVKEKYHSFFKKEKWFINFSLDFYFDDFKTIPLSQKYIDVMEKYNDRYDMWIINYNKINVKKLSSYVKLGNGISMSFVCMTYSNSMHFFVHFYDDASNKSYLCAYCAKYNQHKYKFIMNELNDSIAIEFNIKRIELKTKYNFDFKVNVQRALQ
jgi:hypothetical protein